MKRVIRAAALAVTAVGSMVVAAPAQATPAHSAVSFTFEIKSSCSPTGGSYHRGIIRVATTLRETGLSGTRYFRAHFENQQFRDGAWQEASYVSQTHEVPDTPGASNSGRITDRFDGQPAVAGHKMRTVATLSWLDGHMRVLKRATATSCEIVSR